MIYPQMRRETGTRRLPERSEGLFARCVDRPKVSPQDRETVHVRRAVWHVSDTERLPNAQTTERPTSNQVADLRPRGRAGEGNGPADTSAN